MTSTSAGATPEGRKELIGFTDGARESAQDWAPAAARPEEARIARATKAGHPRWRARLLDGSRRAVAATTLLNRNVPCRKSSPLSAVWFSASITQLRGHSGDPATYLRDRWRHRRQTS